MSEKRLAEMIARNVHGRASTSRKGRFGTFDDTLGELLSLESGGVRGDGERSEEEDGEEGNDTSRHFSRIRCLM